MDENSLTAGIFVWGLIYLAIYAEGPSVRDSLFRDATLRNRRWRFLIAIVAFFLGFAIQLLLDSFVYYGSSDWGVVNGTPPLIAAFIAFVRTAPDARQIGSSKR
jgi:hypothetical protein